MALKETLEEDESEESGWRERVERRGQEERRQKKTEMEKRPENKTGTYIKAKTEV